MKPDEPRQNTALAEKLIAEQNFGAALAAGLIATLIAAVAYGIVTVMWSFAYGFALAVIGIVIGLSMQFLGRGIELKFAMAASMFTIAGCFLGSVFSVALNAAQSSSMSLMDVFRGDVLLRSVEPAAALSSPVDLVYWLVAVAAAAFLSRRPLSRADRLALGQYSLA